MLVAAGLVIAGCGGQDPFDQPQRQVNPEGFGVVTDPSGPPSPAPPPPAATGEQPGGAAASRVPPPPPSEAGGPPAPPAEAASGQPPGPAQGMEREEVHVGVGKKGDYEPGLITTPVSAYFRVQERITFDQIKHDLQLYTALKGQGPQSHEEFMKEIIEKNGRKLPELPRDHRYVFDPESQTLMVERPE
jgi:hypothetical protein